MELFCWSLRWSVAWSRWIAPGGDGGRGRHLKAPLFIHVDIVEYVNREPSERAPSGHLLTHPLLRIILPSSHNAGGAAAGGGLNDLRRPSPPPPLPPMPLWRTPLSQQTVSEATDVASWVSRHQTKRASRRRKCRLLGAPRNQGGAALLCPDVIEMGWTSKAGYYA